MSTEAEELAKTVLGIKARHIVITLMACCGFLASVAGGVAGYQQLGWPVPATRDYVDGQVMPVSQAHEELAKFALQSRMMILSDTWWRLQEKIEEVGRTSGEFPDNSMLRDQLRRLKRDQAQVQGQIDSLERDR